MKTPLEWFNQRSHQVASGMGYGGEDDFVGWIAAIQKEAFECGFQEGLRAYANPPDPPGDKRDCFGNIK